MIAAAAALPSAITPQAPFPKIFTDASQIDTIAPGVTYGLYEMRTAEGPLSLHVIAIDPRTANVRIGSLLASDQLVSGGETVSAMARRSGAVAGINGDYFDINNTNEPLNIVVQNGKLLRTPMQRYALAITTSHKLYFSEFTFSGSVQMENGQRISLDAVNVLSAPRGGLSLLTPEFGRVPAQENVTLVALTPLQNDPPFTSYRVTAIADNTSAQPPGYYLAIGLRAYDATGVPNLGDTLLVTDSTIPSLHNIATAIGGGPLLVRDGLPFADPDGPGGGEFLTHIPASGVGITRDGHLLLFEVDGRQTERSIGLTRRQFSAAMIAFGTENGMAFDGGGSSTIVAREPGNREATIQNSPSDGFERKVANGLFVYNDTPAGPATHLVVDPQTVRALVGAQVPFRVSSLDDAGHPVGEAGTLLIREPSDLASVTNGVLIAGPRPGAGTLYVKRGRLSTEVPIHVFDEAARIEILPRAPNVEPNGRIRLSVRAFDARGYAIALPKNVEWSTSSGRIARDGTLDDAQQDALVRVRFGRSSAETRVSVGSHAQELQIGNALHFETIPRGGPGSLESGPCDGCLTLRYDFTGDVRAAYASGRVVLPQEALELEMDVLSDGKGAVLRVALENAINERVTFSAARLDWTGWRHVAIRLPASLSQPATLRSIYVLSGLAGPPVHVSGSVALRNLRVVLAGSTRENIQTPR
ncbi:MAG: phosphodiester glycosidase family protein [Candidatus Eremiobacteraeota bacterium]|nr:phosphodiester glycosidase family protein [Candidatus Eremiobacteraeota bacterium]